MIAIVPVERKEEVNLIFDCRASILEVSFGFEFVIHCLIFRFLIFNFDILTMFFHIIMVKKKTDIKDPEWSQEVSPFQAGEHNAAVNRHKSMTNTKHK